MKAAAEQYNLDISELPLIKGAKANEWDRSTSRASSNAIRDVELDMKLEL
jgi:hypothetical protein